MKPFNFETKGFQHRDKWFYIFDKWPWRGKTRYALHVHDVIFDKDIFYFYVAKDDTLWMIGREHLLANREIYKQTGKYHIDKEFLTSVDITPEWREEINKYERKVKV